MTEPTTPPLAEKVSQHAKDLIAGGFTREQAFELARDYQTHLFTLRWGNEPAASSRAVHQ